MSEETTSQNEETKAEAGDSAEAEETVRESETVEAYSPDDAILERAVKAGMSLSDAKALPSKEFADRILGVLESRNAESAAGRNGDDNEDPVVDFSGFGVDNGYDETLVKAFNSLRSVVESQAKMIKKLKAGEKSPSAKATETRRNLTLVKPGGESGSRKQTPKDAEADILSALRSKYKLN